MHVSGTKEKFYKSHTCVIVVRRQNFYVPLVRGSGTKAKFLHVPLVRGSGTKTKFLQFPHVRDSGKKAKFLRPPRAW